MSQKQSINELNETLSLRNEQIYNLENEISKLIKEKNDLMEKKNLASEKLDKCDEDASIIQSNLEKSLNELEQCKVEVNDCQEQIFANDSIDEEVNNSKRNSEEVVNQLTTTNERLLESINEYDSRISSLESELNLKNQEIDRLKDTIQTYRIEIITMDQNFNSYKNQRDQELISFQNLYRELEASQSINRQNFENELRRELEESSQVQWSNKLNEINFQHRQQMSEQENELKRLHQSTLNTKDQEISQLKKSITIAREEYQEIQRELSACRGELMKKDEEITKETEEFQKHLKNENDRFERESQQFNNNCNDKLVEISKLQSTVESQSQQLASQTQALSTLRSDNQNWQERYDAAVQLKNNLNSQYYQKSQDFKDLQSRFENEKKSLAEHKVELEKLQQHHLDKLKSFESEKNKLTIERDLLLEYKTNCDKVKELTFGKIKNMKFTEESYRKLQEDFDRKLQEYQTLQENYTIETNRLQTLLGAAQIERNNLLENANTELNRVKKLYGASIQDNQTLRNELAEYRNVNVKLNQLNIQPETSVPVQKDKGKLYYELKDPNTYESNPTDVKGLQIRIENAYQFLFHNHRLAENSRSERESASYNYPHISLKGLDFYLLTNKKNLTKGFNRVKQTENVTPSEESQDEFNKNLIPILVIVESLLKIFDYETQLKIIPYTAFIYQHVYSLNEQFRKKSNKITFFDTQVTALQTKVALLQFNFQQYLNA